MVQKLWLGEIHDFSFSYGPYGMGPAVSGRLLSIEYSKEYPRKISQNWEVLAQNAEIMESLLVMNQKRIWSLPVNIRYLYAAEVRGLAIEMNWDS